MNSVEKIVSVSAGAALGAFTLIISIEVLCRYWLHIPLSWTNELSILLFQWMVFLGAPVALRRGLHFTIDVAVAMLPRLLQRALVKFSVLVALAVGVAFVILGFQTAISTWHTSYTSLPMPLAVSFISAIVSGLLIVLFCLPMLLTSPSDAAAPP